MMHSKVCHGLHTSGCKVVDTVTGDTKGTAEVVNEFYKIKTCHHIIIVDTSWS